ncbi:MAG TPA: hypothetical protein VIY48_18620 [Candidatus Paceibacterota bacterium]
MSEDNVFEFPGENDGSENADPEFEADPATVAFLDQEAAAFREIEDDFEQMYGFRHECKCDQDYAAGRVGEVTECYAGMITESLATCAQLNAENKALKDMIQQLIAINGELMGVIDGTSDDGAEDGEDRTDSDETVLS